MGNPGPSLKSPWSCPSSFDAFDSASQGHGFRTADQTDPGWGIRGIGGYGDWAWASLGLCKLFLEPMWRFPNTKVVPFPDCDSWIEAPWLLDIYGKKFCLAKHWCKEFVNLSNSMIVSYCLYLLFNIVQCCITGSVRFEDKLINNLYSIYIIPTESFTLVLFGGGKWIGTRRNMFFFQKLFFPKSPLYDRYDIQWY